MQIVQKAALKPGSVEPGAITPLQISELRYRRLFEDAQDGIFILDLATLKILDANPYIQNLLGYSKDELVDKELWEIGLLKDQMESQDLCQELQERGFIRYEGLPLQSKDGQPHEVEFISNVYQEGDQLRMASVECSKMAASPSRRIWSSSAGRGSHDMRTVLRCDQVDLPAGRQGRDDIEHHVYHHLSDAGWPARDTRVARGFRMKTNGAPT